MSRDRGVAGGSISIDTPRESILITMIYVFMPIYLFIYLEMGPSCASEAALERVG